MDKSNYMIYLFFMLALGFSCTETKSAETGNVAEEITDSTNDDTLKFTSGIRVIFQDSNGHYWIGSHAEGVSKWDGQTFQYYTVDNGLADNQVRTIQEDKKGNIWFGTGNGVGSFDGRMIKNYTAETADPNLQIDTLAAYLWFSAGIHAGVDFYDGETLTRLNFPYTSNDDGQLQVTDVSTAPDGTVWIATYGSLIQYDGKEMRVYDRDRLKLDERDRLHVRSVLADSKGRIWIGNNGIGVLLLEQGAVSNFSDSKGLIHPSSNRTGDNSQPGTMEHVFAIEEDSKGNIWFGDRDTGVWKYDGDTIINYQVAKKEESRMVWDIYEDTSKNLFVSTMVGVYQFNGVSFDKRF